MRRILLALPLLIAMPLLPACRQAPTPDEQNAYDADAANEDAALQNIRDQDNEIEGVGAAVSGMIPDEHGRLPMANVQ
jgi:hypothetical protein